MIEILNVLQSCCIAVVPIVALAAFVVIVKSQLRSKRTPMGVCVVMPGWRKREFSKLSPLLQLENGLSDASERVGSLISRVLNHLEDPRVRRDSDVTAAIQEAIVNIREAETRGRAKPDEIYARFLADNRDRVFRDSEDLRATAEEFWHLSDREEWAYRTRLERSEVAH